MSFTVSPIIKKARTFDVLTKEEQNAYHNDPRWTEAKACVADCRFGEAIELVNQIQRDHRCR